MALKFLNKKGWHTGSLANIERVWKKEQAHKEEQRKLEEFKKQIAEEAEKAEFRQLQIDAGLVPRQERVDFLYEPGVSKGGSDGFKTLEALPTKVETDSSTAAAAAASSSQQQGGVPGALFEEKPQSANDTWRKLHSDPLLMIKQREQEALARIRNNPVQMAKLKKSVEDKKDKKKKKKHSHKNAKYSSQDRSDSEYEEKRKRGHDKHSSRGRNNDKYVTAKDEDRNRRGHGDRSDSEVEENRERRHDKYSSSKGKETSVDEETSMRSRHYGSKKDDHYHSGDRSGSGNEERRNGRRHDRYPSKDHGSEKYHNSRKEERNRNEERYSQRHHRDDSKHGLHSSNGRSDTAPEENRKRSIDKTNHEMHSPQRAEASNTNMGRPYQKHRRVVTKLSEEEKAARLKEMQMDAVLHEEQRWNRLKKASENDAKEASQASSVGGANFLNAAQKSVYGADKGGSSTIEESVRRRKYFSQGRSDTNEGNAFRR